MAPVRVQNWRSHEPGGATLRRALIYYPSEVRARRSLTPPLIAPVGAGLEPSREGWLVEGKGQAFTSLLGSSCGGASSPFLARIGAMNLPNLAGHGVLTAPRPGGLGTGRPA